MTDNNDFFPPFRFRNFFLGLAVLFVLIGVFCLFYDKKNPLPDKRSTTGALQAFCSPQEQCDQLFITAMTNAKRSIYFQYNGIIPLMVARALLEARERGLKIEVITSKAQGSLRDLLHKKKISLKVVGKEAISTSFLINDNKYLIKILYDSENTNNNVVLFIKNKKTIDEHLKKLDRN